MNCNDDSSGSSDPESMPGLAFTIPNDYLKQHWVHWHNIANGMSDNSSHDSNDEADSDTD